MGRLAIVVVALLVLGGGLAFLATQPAADLPPVPPSSQAALEAEARVFAVFKAAEIKAVVRRAPEPVQVRLSDVELTSLADSRLAQSATTSLHDAIVHGTSNGYFETVTDDDWNGWTLHVFAAGTVTIGADGALHFDLREARVGRLPLPSSAVDALVAQTELATTVKLPPGAANLALEPVDGGAVLTATASPSVSGLVGG